MRAFVLRLFPLFGAAYAFGADPSELPGLKSDLSVCSKATGFFRVEQAPDGAWRFVTPGGHGFFMAGNNGPAQPRGDYSRAAGCAPYTRTIETKYANKEMWAQQALSRMLTWNFNTVTSWIVPAYEPLTHRGLAVLQVQIIGRTFAGHAANSESNLYDNVKYKGEFPNVFSPEFAKHCRAYAARHMAPYKDDPWIIGWCLDNELCWRGAVEHDGYARAGTGMFDLVTTLPVTHSARQALDGFLKERGLEGVTNVSAEVKQDFLRLVARRFFETACSAVREADPNHLILGCRFAGFRSTPDVAIEECGRVCDAISVNSYPPANLEKRFVRAGWRDKRDWNVLMDENYAIAKKPFIITEWAYRAADAGLPNTYGAGQICKTQSDRAASAELFARVMIGRKDIIGYSHFRWVDQPKDGRGRQPGGEDSNYGLVNEDDVPYRELTEMFSRVQGDLYDLRRN